VVELETGSEVAGIAWGQQTSDIHIDRQTDYSSSHTPQLSSVQPTPEDSREIGRRNPMTAAPRDPKRKPTPDDVIVGGGNAPKMAAYKLC